MQAVGEQRRIALGDRRKIRRARQGARDQVTYLRIVSQKLCRMRKLWRRAERLGQTVDDVGAARLVANRRMLGDALEERRHAGLSSCPDA